MNKITPVEWLVQQMENRRYFIGNDLYSAIEEAKRMEQSKYEKVTRFEVIDHTVEFGRLYTKHNCKVELQLQDEDRTLRAFISARRTKLDIFVERLKKAGVEVTLAGNYPWIYLDKINGKRVTETFQGNHGFTIAFLPIQEGVELQFTDIGKIFKLIRKYVKNMKAETFETLMKSVNGKKLETSKTGETSALEDYLIENIKRCEEDLERHKNMLIKIKK